MTDEQSNKLWKEFVEQRKETSTNWPTYKEVARWFYKKGYQHGVDIAC